MCCRVRGPSSHALVPGSHALSCEGSLSHALVPGSHALSCEGSLSHALVPGSHALSCEGVPAHCLLLYALHQHHPLLRLQHPQQIHIRATQPYIQDTEQDCFNAANVSSCRAAIVDMAIQNISTIWSILDPLPHTLSHNDFNPRNICLRLAPQEGSSSQPPTQGVPYPDPRRLCIYDWELACIDVPQHDLAELLAFTLAPSASKETVLELVEFYRQHLEYYSRKAFPKERWVW